MPADLCKPAPGVPCLCRRLPGVAKSKLGGRRGAIADYSRAIEFKPDYAKAYHERGNAKSELGDHDGAEADRKQAIELDPALKDR